MSEKDVIKLEAKSILEKLLQDRGISIYKIVIFGSLVTDKFKEDSDIDVIVISTDFRDKSIFDSVKLITGIGRELVHSLKIPFDLICYSDEEWEKENFLIINEAKEKGEVIYG